MPTSDKGYWKNVEAYITEETGSEFTHGMCPACLEKLREQYPDSFTGEITTDE